MLVSTMESSRFKVHVNVIPIINMSLLDKTVRTHLIQYQIVMNDRGSGTVYRVKPSQFSDKTYYEYFCKLRYSLLDTNLCAKDSCLGCEQLSGCNIFRALYEKKKASIQDDRYEQAKEQAQASEMKHLTLNQLENLSLAVKELWFIDGKLNVQRLRIVMRDTYGIKLSNAHAYELREGLELHHKDKLENET